MNMENKRIMYPVKNIFISRKIETDLFDALKVRPGITLIDESLIKITQVRYSYAPKTKWIFFSSKNGIKYFFVQNPELETDVKFAVIGQSSADYLATFKHKVDFVGKGIDINKIAEDFVAVLQDESVLFPQAIDSLKTVQKHISFSNASHNLFVYKTEIRTDFSIARPDMLVFTSPSNAVAYLGKNKIDSKQIVIAIGATTRNKLKALGVKNILIPETFSEQGLLDLMMQYIL